VPRAYVLIQPRAHRARRARRPRPTRPIIACLKARGAGLLDCARQLPRRPPYTDDLADVLDEGLGTCDGLGTVPPLAPR
jgi:hypothetical protein